MFTSPLASAESAEQPAAPPTWFVSGGALLGGDTLGPALGGAKVEAGLEAYGSLWAHGDAAVAAPTGVDQKPSGHYTAVRFGAENRLCTSTGGACFVSGLDLGWRTYELGGSNQPTSKVSGFQAAAQVGGDFGGRVRFRPAVQALVNLGHDHTNKQLLDGIMFTLSVMYQQ